MRILKTISIFFLAAGLCIFLLSCRTTGETTGSVSRKDPGPDDVFNIIMQAPDADDYIVELIKTNKVVFLPENHSIVNPILFLSDNLNKFYNAGMRYLFLEGGMPAVPDSENYSFYMFYPWSHVGWKYESVLLAQRVKELNESVPESEKLRLIYAEADGDNPHPSDIEQMPAFINNRDVIASDCIISVMDRADSEEKALIFYGGAHGSKNTYTDYRRDNIPPFDWKPLGAYLSTHYTDSFVSLSNNHLSMIFQRDYFTEAQWNALSGTEKIAETDFFSNIFDCLPNPNYDYILLDYAGVYGTNYQYMPTDENLRFIFTRLKEFENSHETSISGNSFLRFHNRGQYLLCIYYLKLFFGDNFNYSFWNPENTLDQALKNLEAYAFAPGIRPFEKISIEMPSEDDVREYHSLMRQSGINRFIVSGDKGVLDPVIMNMEIAETIFSEDIWPLYWMAFAETVQENYAEALKYWRLLLQEPLSKCMENLPEVYQMASECALKNGLTAQAESYSAEAESLWNEHNLDTSGYGDI